jgi:hypothetical protein
MATEVKPCLICTITSWRINFTTTHWFTEPAATLPSQHRLFPSSLYVCKLVWFQSNFVAACADYFSTPSWTFSQRFFLLALHYQLMFLLKEHTMFILASHQFTWCWFQTKWNIGKSSSKSSITHTIWFLPYTHSHSKTPAFQCVPHSRWTTTIYTMVKPRFIMYFTFINKQHSF